MIEYKLFPLSLSDKDAFTEASREELRVLLALIESGGKAPDCEELASRASVSRARCSAALVLWEEAGVISPVDGESHTPTVTEEFEERLRLGEINEQPSLAVAKTIRDGNLADLIHECAFLMGRATLTTAEIKELTAIYDQLGFDPEYILTLAAHIKENGRLTMKKLVSQATKLLNDGVLTVDALNAHMAEVNSRSETEWAFRGIFGFKDRPLSEKEKEYFYKWSHEFGYYTDIVKEAYDITVNTRSERHVAYTDKILTHWYETGCRTLADCRARHEAERAEKRAKAASSKKGAKEPERYGSFDVNDAFMKALDRSYGKEEKNSDS